MTKMFPFIVKDMKNVLIYLPQALCACGIYAVCYGLVTLNTGMLARRLQKNGQQPSGESGGLPDNGQQTSGDNGSLPENGQQPPGDNGNLPERAALSERLNLWLKNAGHFIWKQSVCYLSVDACHDCIFLQRTGLTYWNRFAVYGNMGNNHAGSCLGH